MWSRAQRLTPAASNALAPWKPPPHGQPSARASHGPHAPSPTTNGPHAFDLAATSDEPAADEPTLDEQLADAYASGRADGMADVERAIADERRRLAATIDEIASLRRVVLDAADQDVTRLALGVARRVLHREVQLDPDIVTAMARVALGRLGDRAVAQVRVHPADLAAIAGGPHALAVESGALTIAGDPEIPRGGCRIVSEAGEIDLGVDAQVSELARVLLGDSADGPHGPHGDCR